MSTRAFFHDAEAAKAAVLEAIQKVESQTSAELVVTVRRQAGPSYQDADSGFGALIAMVSLAVILFVDKEFALTWIPIDVAVAFAAGLSSAGTCRPSGASSRPRRAGRTRPIARHARRSRSSASAGAPDETGSSSWSASSERKAAVVADTGVDPFLIAPVVERIQGAVDRAVPDLPAFVEALESLGPVLAPAMPRQADDVNELPDEMGYS